MAVSVNSFLLDLTAFVTSELIFFSTCFSVLDVFSILSTSLSIFLTTFSVTVSKVASTFFSVVPWITLPSFLSFVVLFLACFFWVVAFFFWVASLLFNALYCSIIFSHSSNVLPVLFLILVRYNLKIFNILENWLGFSEFLKYSD